MWRRWPNPTPVAQSAIPLLAPPHMKMHRTSRLSASAPDVEAWPVMEQPVIIAVPPAIAPAAMAAVDSLIAHSAQAVAGTRADGPVRQAVGTASKTPALKSSASARAVLAAAPSQSAGLKAPARGVRSKGGGTRAIGTEDNAPDDVLLNQLTGSLSADLIAMQPIAPRGRRRRGSRIGALGSGGSSGAVDADEPAENVSPIDALPLTPAAIMFDDPDTDAPAEQGDPILLRGMKMLAGLSELARQAGAVSGNLPGSIAVASRSGNRAATGTTESMPAGAESAAATIGRHGRGHAGSDQPSENPAPQASDQEPPSADDAAPAAAAFVPYAAPSMNRRLETNGVDDALILMLVLRQMPIALLGSQRGPAPVTQAQAIPSRLPPSMASTVDRPQQRVDQEGDAEAFRRWLSLARSVRRERNRHRLFDRRFRPRLIGPGKRLASRRSHGKNGPDNRNEQTSGKRDVSAAECAAFWAGGCACSAAQSGRSAGASAILDPPAS